jgi:hypothetical protein
MTLVIKTNTFLVDENWSKSVKIAIITLTPVPVRIQCFPFYSILLALGNPTVDLFSLDIEGAELQGSKAFIYEDKLSGRDFFLQKKGNQSASNFLVRSKSHQGCQMGCFRTKDPKFG